MLKEQDILDGHDDEMATLSTHIKRLIVVCDSSSEFGPRKIASQRLVRLGRNLFTVNERIDSLSGGPDDVCLLRKYEEQFCDLKVELGDLCSVLLSLGIEESDQLYTSQTQLDKELFDCSLKIKKLLFLSGQALGVKLPKLDVPKFDGNIINWRNFWEQFSILIHSQSGLSDAEKLVYLRHSLKDGTAKGVIEGLSRSDHCYSEAIESLKARYDRPRLIHQTHVRMILEATPLRDGTGKELRRLYDVVQQHLRALKAMEYEPSSSFITSVLELKLDTNTMFEWQKYSQDSVDVPHYQSILEFINLCAQASEALVSNHNRASRVEESQ